jgi:hypothetical protein
MTIWSWFQNVSSLSVYYETHESECASISIEKKIWMGADKQLKHFAEYFRYEPCKLHMQMNLSTLLYKKIATEA